MTTLEEFSQKVAELRQKLDFDFATPQKNKTLLLTIKEYCNSCLTEEDIDNVIKSAIKSELAQIETDMSKIKGISHESDKSPNSSSNSNLFSPQRPTKEALTSIQAGSFDPNSSPILRKLHRKTIIPSKSHSKKTTTPKNPEAISNSTKMQEKAKALETIGESFEDLEDATDAQLKILQKSLSSFEAQPFPGTAVDDGKTTVQTTEMRYTDLELKIPQLEVSFTLEFSSDVFQIGRDLLLKHTQQLQLPGNFYDPILAIEVDAKHPKEHCIIEQPEKGTFFLKDRSGVNKTFYKGQFVDKAGMELHDGDSFILPVQVNNQLSSLSIEVHFR